MEETVGSGCTGPLMLVAVVLLVVAIAAVGVVVITERITEHQATAAQQATLQEQARTEAAQAQARADIETTRTREDAHTERWQSFLVAMRSDPVMELAALVAFGLWIIVAVVWLLERRRRA